MDRMPHHTKMVPTILHIFLSFFLKRALEKVFIGNIFAERYQEQILTNDFVLGYYCHLIQDAVWFHDIVDTNIRCYVGDEKKQAYRRGYRDYERLN